MSFNKGMGMKFGYTIVYVTDVAASLAFFEKAFGLKTRFIHESGYGELETGQTTLALVTESVAAAHAKAVSAGARSIKEPLLKPWGQTVSYVRCPDGTLVELCSPIST